MILDLDIPEKILDKNYIKQFLPENPIIVEAGGHIGRDCIKMAKTWPKSVIYTFEPVDELYKKLKENTETYPNIKCFNYALADYIGKNEIYISSGRSTALSSLYKPITTTDIISQTFFTKDYVNLITLDQWAKEHNINYIDFIWLDVQGGELSALKGGQNLLNNVKAIFVEVNIVLRYESATDAQELINWLKQKSFLPIAHDKPVHNKTNILFVKY